MALDAYQGHRNERRKAANGNLNRRASVIHCQRDLGRLAARERFQTLGGTINEAVEDGIILKSIAERLPHLLTYRREVTRKTRADEYV